jgi:predicted lipoprotein with Yx(FWY)xxD motif
MKTRILAMAMVSIAVFAAAVSVDAVTVRTKAGVGDYIADSKGMTLYYFKNDSPGKSACTGGCIDRWPVFYSDAVKVPEGLDAREFGAITRPDGKRQTTFRGYPLYYFAGDREAGDVNGHGMGDVWLVVNPATFMK